MTVSLIPTAMRSARGFAVPLVLVVLVALGLVGAAAAFLTAGDANVAALYSTANRANDAAGAGLEHGIAQYRDLIKDWNPSQGDQGEFVLAADWPVGGEIDGYDYDVTIARDSFDFDGDGTPEAVYCEGNGNGGDGSDGDGGSGGPTGGGGDSSGGGSGTGGGGSGGGTGGSSGSTPVDSTSYWEDGSSTDKDGDGALGFAEGHFDVDVFTQGTKGSVGREYHQHQFDDKYDTKSVDLLKDPNLKWNQLVGTSYPNNLRVEFMNSDSARGSFAITVNGVQTVQNLQSPTTMTVDPKKVTDIRVTFESLGSLRKTNPGQVSKDALNRDWAWTVRFYDAVTGRLVYESSEYWHYNRSGGSTTSESSGGSSGSTGGTSGTTTSGGGKHCKDAAEHEKKALAHEENARKKEAEAAVLYAKGKTSDGDKKMAEAAGIWAKAAEEWAKAEDDCEKAKAAGETCVCGNYGGGGEPEAEDTPPDSTSTPPDTTSTPGDTGSGGGSGGQWCTVNGDGDGNPVFVLTSTATRGAWRATQRMRVTAMSGNRVLRLSWVAN